jgi:osmotically-inducible protein OsmY
MRLALLFLVVLLASPALSCAQSTTPPAETKRGGNEVKDSWITSKTKLALITDSRTKARRIKVETYRGVVTLRGKVASGEERSAAEEITKRVDGVASVRNTLEIVPEMKRKALDSKDDELTKSVENRLATEGQLKDASIRVRTDNGMVTLMGTVPTMQAKTRAGDVVRKVPGVRGVRNELEAKS